MLRAILKLEFIGENYFAYKRAPSAASTSAERYSEYLGRDQSRPWVARLTGCDEKFGFAREFMRGQIDYSQSNRVGSRGVYLYFALKDGIYEINERESWNRVRRYFIRVENADYQEIEREEAAQCLISDC